MNRGERLNQDQLVNILIISCNFVKIFKTLDHILSFYFSCCSLVNNWPLQLCFSIVFSIIYMLFIVFLLLEWQKKCCKLRGRNCMIECVQEIGILKALPNIVTNASVYLKNRWKTSTASGFWITNDVWQYKGGPVHQLKVSINHLWLLEIYFWTHFICLKI